MSVSQIVEKLSSNDASMTTLEMPHAKTLSDAQCEEIATALASNTVVTKVVLDNKAISSAGGEHFAKVVESNSTITELDLGYNNINGEAMVKICSALKTNKTIKEMKIHRQAKDYGSACESKIIEFWAQNTTLCRLYGTFHDRTFNQVNTRGEVRNKEISKRISQGKDWIDLSPFPDDVAKWKTMQAEARAKKEAEEAAANAPISEKVASTGGPYSYKQLTCDVEFRPDDVDTKQRETYLSDDEFQTIFGMDKAAFAALPKWKMNNKKKEKKLH